MAVKIRFVRLCVCIAVFSVALFGYFAFFAPSEPKNFNIEGKTETEAVISSSNGVETVGEGIDVISVPRSAERGSSTGVYFKGEPGKEYEIRVFYASGVSGSQSFLPVKADDEGLFSWEWKISPNARVGDIRIIVTGESCRVSFEMRIL